MGFSNVLKDVIIMVFVREGNVSVMKDGQVLPAKCLYVLASVAIKAHVQRVENVCVYQDLEGLTVMNGM